MTTSSTVIMAAPVNVRTLNIDTIEVKGSANVGFLPRGVTNMNVFVRRILGYHGTFIRVDKNINLFWATSEESLSIDAEDVYVAEGGEINLPRDVTVKNGHSLDVCGTFDTSSLKIQGGGIMRISNPATYRQLKSFTINYNGRLEQSTYCPDTNNGFIMQIDRFDRYEGFTVKESDFKISANEENVISPILKNDTNNPCKLNGNLNVMREQVCNIPPGDHQFGTITVQAGGELHIDGSSDGAATTTINAVNFNIMFDSKITGVGAGYLTGGPGSPVSSGKMASHGGIGIGNIKPLYGSIDSPMQYGSNGYAATNSSGRGGGQIKIVADSIIVDGLIDMSAAEDGGGSGGSVFLQAVTIKGSGKVKAEGSKGGGGGGRISLKSSSSFTYTGELSAKGGIATSGQTGSSGEKITHSHTTKSWTRPN